MNLQRITAITAIGAAVLGGAALLTLGAGAAGLELPELPNVPLAEPTTEATPAAASEDDAETLRTPDAAPAALRAPVTLPTTDPDSPEYNPYTTPGDEEYVEQQERAEYLGKETVIGECMAEQGLPYNVVGWWTGQDAQPKGLDYETSIRWLDAYYGEQDDDWAVQIDDWQRQGCLGAGEHAAEEALAAGTPLTAEVPADDPSLPTEREQWREYQGYVAECMTDRGQEYLPYDPWGAEWEATLDPMNPAIPGQPEGLTPDEQAAWDLALGGDAGTGAAYRWEDAGCWGYATHMTGNDNMH